MHVSTYTVVLFVHIGAALLMVSGSVLARVLKMRMHSTRDAAPLVALVETYRFVPMLVMPNALLVIGTGSYLAWHLGYGFMKPWILGSYAGFVLAFGLVHSIVRPTFMAAAEVIERMHENGSTDTAELHALVTAPKLMTASLIADSINFVTLFLMVFKPGQ